MNKYLRLKAILISIVLISSVFVTYTLLSPVSAGPSYNYSDALGKSIMFYEAQQSGTLPSWNRVSWRGASALSDGSDVGKDLTGGWYDAGDHVKFGLPMAASATMLAWGAIEYRQGFDLSGQMDEFLNNLKFVNDYFIKSHEVSGGATAKFYGQVGNGGADHAYWGPAESMTMSRPAYYISPSKPGSDLAAETAAAMAASSIVFRSTNSTYADTLLSHAEILYTFADAYRGEYHNSITDAASFYRSYNGYIDELGWGAYWLYKAKEAKTAGSGTSYLTKAETFYSQYLTLLGTSTEHREYKWTINWNDKYFGLSVLLAKETGKTVYKEKAEKNLDWWSVGLNSGSDRVGYTPGGLAYLDGWGALRYASNAAFLAFVYSDWTTDATLKSRYQSFAANQLNYILGSNPSNMSYLIGFGTTYPKNPHHRNSHGSTTFSISDPPTNRYTLNGALVGGPNSYDAYDDNRSNYERSEVACDYNAAFVGNMARMVMGAPASTTPTNTPSPSPVVATPTNTPTPTPVAATPTNTPTPSSGSGSGNLDVEFYNGSLSGSNGSINPSFRVTNKGTTSINLSDITLRYYYTIDGEKTQNFTVDYTTVGTSNVKATFVKMTNPVSNADYYLEIGFNSGAGTLSPGANAVVQGRMYKSDWSNYTQTNDYSFHSTATTYTKWDKVTGYSAGSLVWGVPAGSSSLTTPTPSPVVVTPTNTPTPSPVAATPTITPSPSPVVATPTNTATPSTSTKAIPGRIEAEGYNSMSGIQLITSEGGQGVGHVEAGDWMDYSVNVQSSGTYTVNFRVARGNSTTGGLDLRSNGTTLCTISIPNTGSWDTYQTVSTNVTLNAGTQTLRIYASSSYWNINWFEFTTQQSNPTPTPTPSPVAATPTNTPTPSPVAATPTPTQSPSSSGGLKVQFYNGSLSETTNGISPKIKIVNTGTTSINLADVKVRYYYTINGEQTQSFAVDYASVGSNITSSFVKMTTPTTTADYYLEIGFTSGAGSLAAGASTEIQARFNKSDWSNYTQTDDYSFNSSASSYVDWNKVTGWISGSLKWGTQP